MTRTATAMYLVLNSMALPQLRTVWPGAWSRGPEGTVQVHG